MLSTKTYKNPDSSVWGTFERERERLNLQEVKPCFTDDSGLAPQALREAFNALHEQLLNEPAVLRKAKLFEFILHNGRISVDPQDWFANKLDHQGLMQEFNASAMNGIPALYIPKVKKSIETAGETGYYETGLDVGHVSPGWRYMFKKGISGLLEDAKTARDKAGKLTAEQTTFYDAVEIVYKAITAFTRRLSDMAASYVGLHDTGADARLLSMADSLQNISTSPPADFHEALQFTFIMHQMIELEGELVRSMGGFDRNFFGYYDTDVKAGKLNTDTTKELIKFFFTKFYAHTRGASNGKNFYFGGQLSDGSNAENELTYVALEAYSEMNTTDPKLSVRFYKDSTARLYKQVATTIRAGRTAFVLANDEVAIPAIVSQGKTLEEACDYLLIGCYEPAIEGKEIACNMSISLNLSKGIELVFSRGIDIATGTQLGPNTGDPLDFCKYEDFENAYFIQLRAQIDAATHDVKQYELYWPLMNPSPVLAGTFEDALKTGRDIGQCGPKYNNTGCMGAGLATAVDSLAAIKYAIFESNICTMAEMLEAIQTDYTGHDRLRLYLQNRIPRWGTANPKADAIAKKITDTYCAYVNSISNSRGGKFVPSMFSLAHRYSLGKGTSALPDGRGRAEPLSLNNAANPGKDTEGITALLQSLNCLDYTKLVNGSVTDVYLHPSAVKGDDGLNALVALIKTYFARGGYAIQFNIFDLETLIDAQKHPEKYQTLQIRVCGWNVYFVTMSAFEQEQYIKANIHSV